MKITEKRIIQIIETVFKQKRGSLNRNTPIESFARDSMDIVEFLAILDRNYNIQIAPDKIIKMFTVQDILEYALHYSDSDASDNTN